MNEQDRIEVFYVIQYKTRNSMLWIDCVNEDVHSTKWSAIQSIKTFKEYAEIYPGFSAVRIVRREDHPDWVRRDDSEPSNIEE